MKKLFLVLLLIAGQVAAQTSTRINSLPVKNTPDGTDSIPAEDVNNVTWRIPFSKFGAGGGGGSLPDMTNNQNKILTNNGTVASWTPTPTITLTNATGLPVSTGVSGLGTGVAAWLADPTSVKFATAVTGENGTGNLIFSPGTLNITTGKTLNVSNTLTFSATGGADTFAVTVPSSGTMLMNNGYGGGLTVTATGFNGNLATTDDTIQEIAQKLDDLTAGGGGGITDLVNDTTPQLGGDLDLNGRAIASMVASTLTPFLTPTQLILAGNQTANAWTTNGLRIRAIGGTLTDNNTAASGTVNTGYSSVIGGQTIAATNTGVTYDNYYSLFVTNPNPAGPGANVTLTTPYALGADSLRVLGSTGLNGALTITGVVTPATLTTDVDNYDPTSPDVTAIRLDPGTANRNITGLIGGRNGRVVTIINIGTNSLVLKNDSTSSTATNRFLLGPDAVILPTQSIALRYDTNNRWRPLSSYVKSLSATITGGSTGTPTAWPSNATEVTELATSAGPPIVGLTQDRWATLPAAASYPSGTVLRYVDAVTAGNFGRWFRRLGSDTVNGLTLDVQPFVGGANGTWANKSISFQTNGLNNWTVLGTAQVNYFEDADSTKKVLINASLQQSGVPGTVTFAAGPSVTMAVDSAPSAGTFYTGVNANGTAITSAVYDAQTVTSIYDLTNANSTSITPSDGSLTIVRLIPTNALSASRSYVFPTAANYSAGKTITFFDSTGGIDSGHSVTFSSSTSNFNGNSTVTVTKPYTSVVFRADPMTNTWTYAQDAIDQLGTEMAPMQKTGTAWALTYSSAAKNAQNFYGVLSGNTTVTPDASAPNGTEWNLDVTQPATGGTYNYTLLFPAGAVATTNAGAAGVGLLTIATGAGARTWVRMWKSGSLILAKADFPFSPAAGATSDVETGVDSAIGGPGTVNQGNTANSRYVSGSFVAGTSRTITKVDLRLYKAGTIGGTRSVAIYTDGVRYTKTDVQSDGTDTISSVTSTWGNSDVGQRVTGGNIPANTFIGVVTDGQHVRLSSSRTNPTAFVTVPTSSGTPFTCVTWGFPDTVVASSGTTVDDTVLPTTLSTTFSFAISAAVTANNTYHVVLTSSDTTYNAGVDDLNYVVWEARTGQGVTSHQASYSSLNWTPGSAAGKTPQFVLWH